MPSQSFDHFEAIHAMLAAHLPEYRIQSVIQLGEGQENVAYEVNDELIVRFRKESDPARRSMLVDREARLLQRVAAIATLPIPEPYLVLAEQGCLAYFKLPGSPLLDIPESRRWASATSVAATLGELLAALHAVPTDQLAYLVDTDDQPLEMWRLEAAELFGHIASEISAPYRRRMEAFFEAPPPEAGYARVFSHNDLGIEHVLVDPLAASTVTGIIDWSDAAIDDPAYDFGLIYRDLGPAALEVGIASYHTSINDVTTLAERAVFYARCSVVEDLAYGFETDQFRYVDRSLAALEWLFE